MVCGTPMAFPCEPEFESALELVERYGEERLEMQTEVLEGLGGGGLGRSLGEKMLEDLERRFLKRLKRMGMAWHPRWEKLVHGRCMKKSEACGCAVPVGVPLCPVHKRPVSKVEPARKRPKIVEERAVIKKAPSPKKQVVLLSTTTSSKPVRMVKATWLKPSAPTVSVHPQPVTSTEFKPVVLPKPPIPKPNPKLEAAAKGSNKLDGWTGKASSENPALESAPTKKDKKFNLARHEREFDQFQHGYLRKNGIDMYRFPDGTEVQVYSTVNVLTEDGQLKASAAVSGEEAKTSQETAPSIMPKTQHAKPNAPRKANPKLEAAAKGSTRLDTLFKRPMM